VPDAIALRAPDKRGESVNTAVTSGDPPILQVRGLHKSFGPHHVLRGVDLSIPEGKTTVIIGGSGSGKSVLLKHLIALLRPDRGEVLFRGRNIHEMSGREMIKFRSKMGMLFQMAALFDSMSVYDNVAFPLREHRKLSAAEEKEQVLESLHALGLEGMERKFPSELSGGQRKRVSLARATILGPEIILYDEPTTGLDPIMIKQVDDMIAETQARLNVTSIVISHDMASTFRIAHRIAMLYKGRIIETGDPAELRVSEHPQVQRFINVSGTGPLQPAGATA